MLDLVVCSYHGCPDIYQLVKNHKDFERIDILKAMAGQESFGMQWGYGSKNYRMTVGGYDEAGSKGFNQVKNKYSYGGRSIGGDGAVASSTCTYVSAYDSNVSKINHYDPAQNIIAKAAFMAGTKGDCGRTMSKAFATTNGWKATHNKTDAILKKMMTGTTPETITGSHQDDALELLSKAIGAYNQGISTFNGTASWSEELIDNPLSYRTDKDATAAQKRKAKAIKYVFDTLKNQATTKPDQNVLPYRSYIWKGGTYPEDLIDEAGNPDPRAGTEWCFKYGEEEWVDDKVFDDVKVAADLYDEEGDMKTQTGTINCLTGAPI